MKTVKVCMSFGAIVFLALMLNGCEAEEKKSSDLGKVPQKTLDNAKKKIDDIEKKMKDRMKEPAPGDT